MMTLFVGNIPYDTTEQEIRDVLPEADQVVDIRRPQNRETGKPRGFAFVTYSTREVGEGAMDELDGTKLHGRALNVNEAEERSAPVNRDRPRRVSTDVEVSRRVDDRPVGPDGKKVRYKSI